MNTARPQPPPPVRQPHAVSDLASRRPKAQKIEQLLQLRPLGRPLRLLEIGCGSGGIAHYFATHPHLGCEVTAVDVHDSRQVHTHYTFVQVQGVELPFASFSFDAVISNHVIEHVGTAAEQLMHLQEIRRVLAPGASAYLAVPNRWMLTEPHYRLKFLSWWPHAWRTPYLRLMGKGDFYDCEPLQMHELQRQLDAAAFTWRNLSIEGWRATFDLEHPQHWSTRAAAPHTRCLAAPTAAHYPHADLSATELTFRCFVPQTTAQQAKAAITK